MFNASKCYTYTSFSMFLVWSCAPMQSKVSEHSWKIQTLSYVLCLKCLCLLVNFFHITTFSYAFMYTIYRCGFLLLAYFVKKTKRKNQGLLNASKCYSYTSISLFLVPSCAPSQNFLDFYIKHKYSVTIRLSVKCLCLLVNFLTYHCFQLCIHVY